MNKIHVNFEFCNFCNQNCKMCIISSYKKHGLKKKFISFENWDKGISSLSKFKNQRVNVAPHWIGEPLLHPRFGEFVLHAFHKNKANRLFNSFTFSTNGVLLNKHLKDIMKCVDMKDLSRDTFYFVNVSLDAYYQQTYRIIKGYNHLELVKRNTISLLKEESLRGINYPKVHLSFVVMEDNFREARPFLDYWSRIFKGFQMPFEVTFKFPSGDVNAIYFRRLSAPNQKEQQKANELHIQTVKKLGILNPFKESSEQITKGEF